ncbi:MAG: hypothetical protein NPIRA02_30990 [Nitrospirales bacterium]|nr:MAG: hypothetical protein NPIRA02_30990 [Nitrospirales bacterium]
MAFTSALLYGLTTYTTGLQNYMATHDLYLDILPSPQRRLWDDLVNLPGSFTLYGGTAIALQIGHRPSIDFDFFAFCSVTDY